MKKKLLLIFATLVVIAINLYVYFFVETAPADREDKPLAAENKVEQDNSKMSWLFLTSQDKGITPDSPMTDVILLLDEKRVKIATYNGNCYERPPEDLLEGEISGAFCWWAGGGKEYGVFKESGRFVIKTVDLSEGENTDSRSRSGTFVALPNDPLAI